MDLKDITEIRNEIKELREEWIIRHPGMRKGRAHSSGKLSSKWWLQLPQGMVSERCRDWIEHRMSRLAGKRTMAHLRRDIQRSVLEGRLNTLTPKEWAAILKGYDYRCAYCGKEFSKHNPLQVEHIVAVTNGGDNIKENVVPACQECNNEKYRNYDKYFCKEISYLLAVSLVANDRKRKEIKK